MKQRSILLKLSRKSLPGSMEKPLAVKKLLLNKGIDAVAVLGIIEKGEQHTARQWRMQFYLL